MAKSEEIFSYEEFIETQVKVFEVFEGKVNTLFIENIASQKKSTRAILLELIGLLRQTLSWYNKINKAMLIQNKKKIPKQKISLN